ncbi:hypothetical protein HPB52_022016 [Rhipicephalus sanguineus]|uniref:Endonuclease/exonuclease/phosphatase domain-containing protein n=1 Tax=Rhipicephalus sanguineus TaxID=34632 RepID=A0A9D4SWS9_RHISA|nr:hypothetical protein HPB52_022016 [Rhipicephalus sanguineus]
MHGARKPSKWEELYGVLDSEAIELYAVAETHLRELEEPPVNPLWQWAGNNREGEARKGGGIGFLWRSGQVWEKLKCQCSEHMWIRGAISGTPTIACVLYLTVTNGQHDGNVRVMQCISEDIQRWGTDSEVLILGDFNGHIQEIDGFLDFNGDLMQQCTRRHNLEVANLRPDCEGEFTWCARNSRTCIDYVLVSSRLACQVKHISIDEEGDFSIGSDHNRIRLTICSSTWCKKEREHRKPGQRFLPEAAYEDIAKEFDSNLQTSKPLKYEEYVEELQRLMRQYEVRTNSRGGVRRKGWWDEEVRKALDERKAANRLHRKAVKTLSASDALQAWQEYLTCKQAMQTIVQSKIAEHNSRQLQSFTADGRNEARKFWTYVSSLDGKAKEFPPQE